MILIRTVICVFIVFVVVILPHVSAADTVEKKETCRFYGNTVETAFTYDTVPEGGLELRAAGKAPLRLAEKDVFLEWPTVTPANVVANRCENAVGFEAGAKRAWFVFIDNYLAGGRFLDAALVDLEAWKVLDSRTIGQIIPCHDETSDVEIRAAERGFDARLEVLHTTDGCDIIDGWVAVRAENDKIKHRVLDDWSPLEKLLQNGLVDEGAGVGKLTQRPLKPISSEKRNRKLARSNNEKGLAALNSNDLAGAAQYFEAGVQADNADVELLNNLGYVYFLQGKREAADKLRQALINDPKRANAWVNLGQYFAEQSKPYLSAACFTLGLRLSAKPDQTIRFIRELAEKNPSPDLRKAVQATLAQKWVKAIETDVPQAASDKPHSNKNSER